MARARLAVKTGSRSTEIRQHIVEATTGCLRERGFAGATTAAIAAAANVNQGVIFYHFSSLANLFAEVLEKCSSERLAAYRAAFDSLDAGAGFDALLIRTVELFREDLASGHVAVLTELVAGSAVIDELRPRLRTHLRNWTELVREIVEQRVAGTPIESLLPPMSQLAVLLVSVYLGAELVTTLDPASDAVGALTDVTERMTLLTRMLGA
jgi:AcrR family transcriptional regulator